MRCERHRGRRGDRGRGESLTALCPSAVSIHVLILCVLFSSSASAQARRDGRLLITVADQTGAVIPGATVAVSGQDAATRAITPDPVMTSDQGVAAIGGLAPGRYVVQAAFPGFATNFARDVRVRTGDNKQTISLEIEKLRDEITVGRDKQESAADAKVTFGSAMTREQIDALSDNPEEMKRQLMDMAGPGAVIRVDSFEGGDLPPKSQIKSIHVTRDTFAAENHNAGAIFIEIITQPGIGALRGGGRFSLRDGSLSGRSPFTPQKGPERTQNYGFNFGGSIVPQKSSFSVSIEGMTSYDTPNLNAALPTGLRSEALTLRTPRDRVNLSVQFDDAITRDQTLRLGFFTNRNTAANLGVGAYDLPERAFSTRDSSYTFRIQEAGPLGRRFFINSRLNVNVVHNERHAALEAPTYRVNDFFTSGGAQTAGARDGKLINFQSDLDYIRGIHSVRSGIALEGGWTHSDITSNYLGTYTFESDTDFINGTPRSYTRRIGDPVIDYRDFRGGFYVQDDIRVRRNLTLSPGARYELQTHVHSFNNIGPRFAVTWAPFKSGKTTLRASTGIFYDWLDQFTYEQTLQVDGLHQRELNIVNPSFPDPGNIGIIPPVNRYVLSDDWKMPRSSRLTLAADQTVTPKLRAGILYTYMRREDIGRGLNLNAPINGVRPDPTFGNIVLAVSDASARQHTIGFNYQIGGLPPPFLPPNAPRVDWKRAFLIGQYTFGIWDNNFDGQFNPPPSGTLATEWGPNQGDVRHRVNFSLITQTLKNLQAQLNLNAATGTPYTILTGRDSNGDLIFNDRPDGVGRNSVRGDGQLTLNANFNYSFQFGKRGGALPPGIRIINLNGAPQVDTVALTGQPRFRVGVYVQAQNLTNRNNYAGYSGSMTSYFFGQPTMVINPRKVDIGMQFQF
jgi:hypothetical protein